MYGVWCGLLCYVWRQYSVDYVSKGLAADIMEFGHHIGIGSEREVLRIEKIDNF